MDKTLLDEIDCDKFFEHVDDFIDFPSVNDCPWDDTFPLDAPLFPVDNSNGIGPDVMHEDLLEFDWLSTLVDDDSFADGGMTVNKDDNSINKEPSHNQFQTSSPISHNQFQTSSPISVLESSSSSSNSCSGGKTLPLSPSHCGTQRARSKRPRPTTFSPRSPIQLIPTSSLFGEKPQPLVAPRVPSGSDYFAVSHPADQTNNLDAPEKKKKKKLKLTFTSTPPEENQNPSAQAVRKCMHCEITKTPQWRAGPMGPKTLCNACGVRYKSGRLFPEYRPAASPTFVPSVHSNSHKKVLEMRNKPVEEGSTTFSVVPAPTTFQPQLL